MSDWTIYVRDEQYRRQGQVDDFTKLEFVSKYNDIGAWTLEMDARLPLVQYLTRKRYGIVLYKGSEAVTGGRVEKIQRKRTASESTVIFSGSDDNVWMAERVGHPQPSSSAPPYSTNEHDVRTGVTSTILMQYVDVNLGPNAIVGRRHPNLTLGSDPLAGTTQTGRVRWSVLLKSLQGLALSGGDLGFRIVQIGSGLVFQVYQPVDRSASVKYSHELGNLLESDYESTGPEVNYLYIGGDGEGTARTIQESSDPDSIIEWDRREEFVDRRDTSDSGELTQTLQENLVDKGAQIGFSLDAIDTPSQQYITHYNLGDKVTAVLDGQSLVDVVREVKMTLTANSVMRVSPLIGTAGTLGQTTTKTFQTIRSLTRRVGDLESRR